MNNRKFDTSSASTSSSALIYNRLDGSKAIVEGDKNALSSMMRDSQFNGGIRSTSSQLRLLTLDLEHHKKMLDLAKEYKNTAQIEVHEKAIQEIGQQIAKLKANVVPAPRSASVSAAATAPTSSSAATTASAQPVSHSAMTTNQPAQSFAASSAATVTVYGDPSKFTLYNGSDDEAEAFLAKLAAQGTPINVQFKTPKR